MARPKKQVQQTIAATLARGRANVAGRKKVEEAASAGVKAPNPPSSSRATRSTTKRAHDLLKSTSLPKSGGTQSASGESSSEDLPAPSKKQKVIPTRAVKTGRAVTVLSSSSDSDISINAHNSDVSEDDDDVVFSASKRRLFSRREALEVATELRLATQEATGEEQQPEGQPKKSEEPLTSPIRPPSTRKAVLNPRAKQARAFKRLRRRRAGLKADQDDSSSSDDHEIKPLYDDDPDHPALDEFDDDEEGVPNGPEPEVEPSETPADGNDGQDNSQVDESHESDQNPDDDLRDFVTDDGPLGIPDSVWATVPVGLTRHSRMPMKDYFRTVVEWLIYYRLSPGFPDKNDEVYRIAWQKLDDEVSGLATSKFVSPVWNPKFTKALQARPKFTQEELAPGDPRRLNKCDACNRSKHPAKLAVKLTGVPYYKRFSSREFLEPVEFDSDSEDDSSAEGNLDEDQNPIEEETRVWLLGANCGSNAQTAHYLLHWKRELMDIVDGRLKQDGLMRPEELSRREAMTPKKKTRLVDEVINSWADAGTIGALYKDYSNSLEAARVKSTTERNTGSRGRR